MLGPDAYKIIRQFCPSYVSLDSLNVSDENVSPSRRPVSNKRTIQTRPSRWGLVPSSTYIVRIVDIVVKEFSAIRAHHVTKLIGNRTVVRHLETILEKSRATSGETVCSRRLQTTRWAGQNPIIKVLSRLATFDV